MENNKSLEHKKNGEKETEIKNASASYSDEMNNADSAYAGNGFEGRIKKNISDKKRYLNMALSLIIAVGLWIFVVNNENPTTKRVFASVPVEFLNMSSLKEADMALTNDTAHISVKIEGQRSAVIALKSTDIVATVDVSRYSEGDNYVDVNVHVPSSVNVVEINPAQIPLSIERVVTEDRDVKIRFVGSVPDNKEAVGVDLSTEIVSVSGAKSAVAQVNHLSAEIDANKLSEEIGEFSAALIPVDDVGNPVRGVEVSVNEVTVKAQLYGVKTVGLNVKTIGSLADNLELSGIEAPETVKIAGPVNEISSINEISSQQIDLSEVTASKEIDLIPDVVGNVKLASSQAKVKVTVTVRKLESRTLSYAADNIKLLNLADDIDIKFSEETVSITIYGTEAALAAISSSDFEMLVDCGGLREGTADVPVEVKLSELAEESRINVSLVKINLTAVIKE